MLAHAQRVTPAFADALDSMIDHPLVGESRHRGLLGALELVSIKKTKAGFEPALNLSDKIAAAGYANGLIFRAFADNILGFAPALCFTEDEFGLMKAKLKKTLDDILALPEVRKTLA